MISPNDVCDLVMDHTNYLRHNHDVIDIFEGNLYPHINNDMSKQFSAQTYHFAQFRAVPINIMPKIIDKLTNIYSSSVSREIVGGSETDRDLLAWYQESMNINARLHNANKLYNLCKTCLIQPFAHNKKPSLRVILNDRFIVYSNDKVDPTKPTGVILLAGKSGNKDIYWVYEDAEFMICNSDREIERGLMAQEDNANGVNPIGRIPFVYVNESEYRLMPKQDVDMLKLTKVIPIMLTDLNVAAMFQAFSVIFGIDVDDRNLKMAPNAFWSFKTDPTSNSKPEVGMLKPQVDYEQVLGLIQSQLQMWMGTKGIRSSTIGGLTPENFASGISKVIDEMDTFEARQKQVSVFIDAEKRFWDLVMHAMHPYWQRTKLIENNSLFTPSAEISTSFAVQLPMQSRGQIVKDLAEEYKNRFTSRRRSIQKLNPELTTEELEELIREIDAEEATEKEEVNDGSEVAADQSGDTGRPETSTED